MHAAKVEVTFGRDVRDVHGYLQGLAVFPDTRRGKRVVDGGQDHGYVLLGLEVEGQEDAVGVGDLVVRDAMEDFGV